MLAWRRQKVGLTHEGRYHATAQSPPMPLCMHCSPAIPPRRHRAPANQRRRFQEHPMKKSNNAITFALHEAAASIGHAACPISHHPCWCLPATLSRV